MRRWFSCGVGHQYRARGDTAPRSEARDCPGLALTILTGLTRQRENHTRAPDWFGRGILAESISSTHLPSPNIGLNWTPMSGLLENGSKEIDTKSLNLIITTFERRFKTFSCEPNISLSIYTVVMREFTEIYLLSKLLSKYPVQAGAA